MKRILGGGATVLGVVAGLLIAATTAAAAPVPAPTPQIEPSQPTTFVRGLSVTGFDPVVAAAHGYKIVQLPNGGEQSVPINAADKSLTSSPVYMRSSFSVAAPATAAPKAHPAESGVVINTVFGNCGYSYIEGEQSGAHQIWLNSGFGLGANQHPASVVKWTLQLTDHNGTSHQGFFAGVGAAMSWNNWWYGLNQHSYSFDTVVNTSEVIEVNGTVCVTIGPSIYLNGITG